MDRTGEVPATGQLNLIPQGVTESNRVGRKCVVKSIQLKMQLRYTPGANSDETAFVYLVLDKQCNGAAAAATDVLTSADFEKAMTNLENSDRFVILKKWAISFNPTAGISGAPVAMNEIVEYYKKVNIPIEYDSTAATGAIGTIRSNNIFLLAGAGLTDDTVAVLGTCRLRFQDN